LAWTPFFPVNSTIPSLRVLLDDDMTDNQKREALLSKLDLLDSIDGRKKGYERQSTHKSINVNSAALIKKKVI
jgi:hypothetical protein